MARDTPLDRDRILDAATETLRRFGPEKTNVVDVARALDVTHGSLYRYFPDKRALLDAVVERWLRRLCDGLPGIAASPEPADARLQHWLLALIALKQEFALQDRELFAAYNQIADLARAVIERHIADLLGQIVGIIQSGIAAGVFREQDAAAAARSVFRATAYFHHPYHVLGQPEAPEPGEVARLVRLAVDGLR